MRTMTRSGETRIWMFNNILQTNGSKTPYVIGNAVDITEQHFLEKTQACTGDINADWKGGENRGLGIYYC